MFRGFELNEELRQHVTLSDYAMKVISLDMYNFGFDRSQKNKSGFLNIILKNYHNDFPLAPRIVLDQIKQIAGGIRGESISSKIMKVITDEFCKEFMKREITKYANLFETDNIFKLKINKDNADLLEEFAEAHYYYDYAPRKAGLAFYLKIIFETYTLLPRTEREKIFYKDIVDVIEDGINRGVLLRLQNKDKTYSEIIPIQLYVPNESKSNELFYSENPEDKKSKFIDGEGVSFTTGSIKIKDIINLKITNNTPDTIVEFIKKTDAFTPPPVKSILYSKTYEVLFTNGGLKRYLSEEDNLIIKGREKKLGSNVYVFEATPSEMFVDLFKFGGQAKIISPISEQEKFRTFYQSAIKTYDTENSVIINNANIMSSELEKIKGELK